MGDIEYNAAEAARYAELHPDAMFVLASDYDAYDARIQEFKDAYAHDREIMADNVAQLESYDARIVELDAECEACDLARYAAEAELARVRAESLRVVPVGEACRICDADEGVILVGGNVYQITDHSEWIGMAEGVRYLHQEIPEYDDDTIVQPVRLERWEDAP